MKRIISLALALCLLFNGFSFAETVPANPEPKRFISKSVVGGKIIETEYIIDENGNVTKAIPDVFKGFVENIDYSNPEAFLREGELTNFTDRVKKVADKINDEQDLTTIRAIWKELKKMSDKNVKEEKFELSADEILENGYLNGCGQYATVFATICRYKGIPAVQVHALNVDYIQKKPVSSSGHVFVEVFIEDTWYLVDSTTGKIFLDYDVNNFSYNIGNGIKYYMFAKSIDNADAGIDSMNKMSNSVRKTFPNKDSFKSELYKDPKYKYIDIRAGQ